MTFILIYVTLCVSVDALDRNEERLARVESNVAELSAKMDSLTGTMIEVLQYLKMESAKLSEMRVDVRLLNDTNIEERVQALEFQMANVQEDVAIIDVEVSDLEEDVESQVTIIEGQITVLLEGQIN